MAGCGCATTKSSRGTVNARASFDAVAAGAVRPTRSGAGSSRTGAAADARSGVRTIDDPIFDAVRQAAAASPTASRILGALAQARAGITVLDDATFSARYKGAAAIYDHGTRQIVIPQRAFASPAQLALTIAHEGVHVLDDQAHDSRRGGASQAITGVRLNGINFARLNEGSDQYSWATETHAYMVEAKIAQELGIRDTGLGTDRNGRPRSYQATLNAVKSHPLYR